MLCLESGRWECEAAERTTGHFCILIYWDCFTALAGLYFIAVCRRLLDVGRLGLFYWTPRGRLKPKSQTQMDDSAFTDKVQLKQVIFQDPEVGFKKRLSWCGLQLMLYMQWGNSSPSQLSLLGALPNHSVSHFHTALASNWKGMCLCVDAPGQCWTPEGLTSSCTRQSHSI